MKKQKNKIQEKSNPLKKYYYLLGFFTFFIFANTLGNGYNMDDSMVTNGHELTSQGFSALGEIFTSNYYKDNMGYAFGYRPMVHISFAIEHELFGEKPGVGHFINVILFALSVVLFFKLLVKWLGEKNLIVAGVVAILFAVHPIHTEVVASLKNRDELLAFLFVLWSALSAHKFLEKGKWISIASIIVLFSFAMLSKKSVYPMAIVIPVAIILLKEMSIKQLVVLCLSFIIPAAIIGSELQLERAGLMIFLPTICFVFMFIIKTNYLSLTEDELKQISLKIRPSIIPFSLILIIGLIASFLSSFVVLFFTLPAFIWLFKTNYHLGLGTLIFLLIGLDILWIHESEMSILVLILGLGYSMFDYLQTKKLNEIWLSIAFVSIIYFLFNNATLGSGVLFISFIVFTLLLKRAVILAILLSIIVLVIALMMGKINLYPVLLLLISVSFFTYQKTKNKSWIRYTAVIVFGITLGFLRFESLLPINSKLQSVKVTQAEKQKFIRNENILKEGRQLEYVENTLVAKHTKEEKIGTGFATLGEYFRLMTFPYELSFYYGYAKTDTYGLRNVWVWLFILIHVGMLVLAFFHIKKNPLITIGVFWYLLCILLFSNWVELVAGMVGERLAFTASAGFCILATGIIFWIKPDLNTKKPGTIGSVLLAVLVLFTGRTMVRNTDWKDTITLMSNDIKHLKNSSQANNIYAMHLMAESTNNKFLTASQVKELQQKAITHFDQATKIAPDYYNVYIDKARATMLTGDYQNGIKSLKQAIRVDPNNEFSYYTMLDLLSRTGEGDQFLKYAKELFKLVQNEYAYGVLARGYFLTNDYVKSKEILLEGIKIYPENESLRYNLRLLEEELKKL